MGLQRPDAVRAAPSWHARMQASAASAQRGPQGSLLRAWALPAAGRSAAASCCQVLDGSVRAMLKCRIAVVFAAQRLGFATSHILGFRMRARAAA